MITARESEEDEYIETAKLADVEDHQAQRYLADRSLDFAYFAYFAYSA